MIPIEIPRGHVIDVSNIACELCEKLEVQHTVHEHHNHLDGLLLSFKVGKERDSLISCDLPSCVPPGCELSVKHH